MKFAFRLAALAVVISLCGTLGFAQSISHVELDAKALPGVEFTRQGTYDGNSLWGYINGGADLYLEYGFSEMMVQDFTWKGFKFKVDAYLMSDTAAAFGIFSVNRYSCDKSSVLTKWDCLNPYQYQAAYGRLYLSIVSLSGKPEALVVATDVAKIILERYKAEPFVLPSKIASLKADISLNEVKRIAGPLAMQNSYPTAETYFYDVAGTYVLYKMPVTVNGNEGTLAYVEFANATDLAIVWKQLTQKELATEPVAIDGKVLFAIGNHLFWVSSDSSELLQDFATQFAAK